MSPEPERATAVPPLIAVTTTSNVERRGLPQVRLGSQYVHAVEAAGGVALLLTPAHRPEALAVLLALADGLLLTGGEDIDPARYGQAPHPATGTPNAARDELEFAALRMALERELPVLAICRGHQLLNVALGGTLVQDLPTQRPGSQAHDQAEPVEQRSQWARVLPGSRLHGILGVERLHVNSFHHQAIDTLAPELEAVVWADDGVVEGVEAREHRWVVGVQWHPERGEAAAPGDPRDPDRRLFWAFVAAACRHAAARSGQYRERLDLVEPEAQVVAADRGAEQHLR